MTHLLLAAFLAIRVGSNVPETPARGPQMAAQGSNVVMTFGAGDAIYFSSSKDGGATFSVPQKIVGGGILPLSRHRGPRVAMAGKAIVVTAVVGKIQAEGPHAHGLPSDGDLLVWRSTDSGKTWSKPIVINDVPAASTEGLHALASDGGSGLIASWLDKRAGKTKLYAARSTDAGLTWSPNFLVYESPEGTICECCAPSLANMGEDKWAAMWRNVLSGSRDMHLATISGTSTGPAQKLGAGTWKLNACPMDGGGLAMFKGQVYSAWRREHDVFLARAGEAEKRLGSGADVAITATKEGIQVAWVQAGKVYVTNANATEPQLLGEHAANVSLIEVAGGVLAAWEADGQIEIRRLP